MKKFKLDKTLPKNLALLFMQRVKDNSNVNLQASKNENGKFEYFTYSQVYEIVIVLALALKKIGVSRGSNVALISDNRKEWLWTDFALLSIGACDVPRGCDSLGNEIRFIINYADCEVGFFENMKQFNKVLENTAEVPKLKKAIIFEKLEEKDINELGKAKSNIQIIQFTDLINQGKAIYSTNPDKLQKEIESEMQKTEGNENATIIFTSGTTGVPKGVMLTHENYITQLSAVPEFMPCKRGDWWLSVLPVWHSFERLIQYVAPFMNSGIAYSKPVASIMLADMEEIKPNWMCGVPRLWEALAKGVNRAMLKKGGITLKLFRFFMNIGKHYKNSKDRVQGHVCRISYRFRFLDFLIGIIPMILLWPIYKLGDILVFRKLRAKFGGRLKIAISGGGALQKDIDDFYRALGLNLLEGYGLSETAPVVSFRYYKQPRPGCVGAIFPTMEVKILKQENGIVTDQKPLKPGKMGLIFVRSKQVMKGYYKRPDLTEKVIDKDGWFNTGDLGLKTYDNELKITGRCKDTIVLLGGENIEPTIIEAGLATSEYIESSMVVGQDQKYLAAIIVPNKELVKAYAFDIGISYGDYESLLEAPEIQTLFANEINTKISISNGFRICERLNRFALIPDSFKVGTELSAKQEMMRYKITQKYKAVIDKLFA